MKDNPETRVYMYVRKIIIVEVKLKVPTTSWVFASRHLQAFRSGLKEDLW